MALALEGSLNRGSQEAIASATVRLNTLPC